MVCSLVPAVYYNYLSIHCRMSLEQRTAAERTYSYSSRGSRQSHSSTGSFQSQSASVARDYDSNRYCLVCIRKIKITYN